MDDVFSVFNTRDYEFIKTAPANGGYKSVQEYEAAGICKHRDGKVLNGRSESLDVSTTLHIKPIESFIDAVGGAKELVGNFVRIDGEEYRISACTTGTNFDTGVVEHYRATLEKDNLIVDNLPLD